MLSIARAKDSGNFGRKSNEKVRFGSFRPGYSGPPLDVVHLNLPTRSDQNFPFHFDKPVHCLLSLHLCWEFEKEITNGKSHSCWLTQFDRKMSHFSRVFPLVSDRSVWHNRKHARLKFRVKNCEELEVTILILYFGIEFCIDVLSSKDGLHSSVNSRV